LGVVKVLVVDDEENLRHMLTLVLKGEYQVKAVASAEAALDELQADRWDIVLSDVRMPGMGGQALLEEIQRRGIEALVIMMSAYGDSEAALEAIKKGAYDYLSKPFKKDDVLLTLRKAAEREKLRRENLKLKEEVRPPVGFEGIIARSASMEAVFKTARKIAGYKSTVLLSGESGTGKELIARAIHQSSDRAQGAWVAVNCGAIPETLLESELFGYVKGAFTDARTDKPGLFQQAHGGTLFLDEVAELPLSLQVKLLRVLQEGEVRRMGDTRSMVVDVRVIAASHQDLGQRVKEGHFREDLYYRLHVLPLHLPPLRERPEDLPLLIQHFLDKHNRKLGTQVQGVEPQAMRLLLDHAWPGNVRELENTLERAVILAEGSWIGLDALPPSMGKKAERAASAQAGAEGDDLSIKRAVRDLERSLIQRALERTGGNRTRASELLELSHRALLYKIKEYGLG
jgi:two-component system response regulator AtoC